MDIAEPIYTKNPELYEQSKKGLQLQVCGANNEVELTLKKNKLKSCTGVLLRADLTELGHSSPFCQTWWDGHALLGQL